MFKDKYDDIINLEYRKSTTRKHMPVIDRAAQFAPFSALTGYDDAVEETARLTEEKIELDEETKTKLNERLNYVKNHPDREYKITYFVADEKKSGGEYVLVRAFVKKINPAERCVILKCGTKIPMEDILDIENEIFDLMETMQ